MSARSEASDYNEKLPLSTKFAQRKINGNCKVARIKLFVVEWRNIEKLFGFKTIHLSVCVCALWSLLTNTHTEQLTKRLTKPDSKIHSSKERSKLLIQFCAFIWKDWKLRKICKNSSLIAPPNSLSGWAGIPETFVINFNSIWSIRRRLNALQLSVALCKVD